MKVRLQIYNGRGNRPTHGDKFVSFQEILNMGISLENKCIIQDKIDKGVDYIGVSVDEDVDILDIVNELCEIEKAPSVKWNENL